MNASNHRHFQHLTIDQWQSYIEDRPDRCIFHHRKWIELLSEQYGFEIQIPAIVKDGQVCAAIPFLTTRGLWGKPKLISLPFSDHVPILSDAHSTLQHLCEQVSNRYRDRFHSIIIRTNSSIATFHSDSPNVLHLVDTDRPMPVIEKAFHSTIRRNLKKCERNRLQFQISTELAAIREFYRLHVLTRQKLGVPVQTASYFHRFWDKLIKPGFGFVGIVLKQGVPVAAGVFLHFNRQLVYKYAAFDPAALDLRPNDWLVFSALRKAVERGDRVFDFGSSGRRQDGLRRFKQKWGATESDIFYNYVVGKPDENTGPSRAVRIATEIIKRSPTAVCRALGKAFYKYSQ